MALPPGYFEPPPPARYETYHCHARRRELRGGAWACDRGVVFDLTFEANRDWRHRAQVLFGHGWTYPAGWRCPDHSVAAPGLEPGNPAL